MLKIVVYDGGWGGNIVASFLRKEIQTVEIIKVIDWAHAPYETKTITEICFLAERCLRTYLGKVDLIVMAGYSAALAADYLRQRYQGQKIVSVGINYYQILHAKQYPDRITLLMNNNLLQSTWREEICRRLPYSILTIPDCSGWEHLINEGELTPEIMIEELSPYFELRGTRTNTHKKLIGSDVVLILNTHLWDLKEEIEHIFGYRVRVLDFRRKLLHDVCLALELLGVDGRRSK